MTRVLAFDFECVLDADAGRRVFGLAGTDAEVRDAMRAQRLRGTDDWTDFAKPGFWQIVAVGLVGLDLSLKRVKLHAEAGLDERSILRLFNVWLDRKPRLLSWNGSGYDLPVARYRALLHGVTLDALYGPESQKSFDSYQHRYGESHIDLMDLLGGYGASSPLKLAEAARLCGLPAKTVTDGSGVEDLVDAGEWLALKSYVLEDSLDVVLLYLRFEVSRGRITQAVYREILAKLNDELSMDHIAVSAAITAWLAEGIAPAPAPEPTLALGVA